MSSVPSFKRTRTDPSTQSPGAMKIVVIAILLPLIVTVGIGNPVQDGYVNHSAGTKIRNLRDIYTRKSLTGTRSVRTARRPINNLFSRFISPLSTAAGCQQDTH